MRALTSCPKSVSLLVATFLLYWLSQHNYLLFHTVIETFSAVVAGCVFLLTLTLADMSLPAFFVVVGCGHGFVAGLTLLHMATYKGMQIIGASDANLPTQLWIAARLVDTGALLVGALMIEKTVGLQRVMGTLSLITAGLLAAIFIWPVFPDCFIEGSGLTPFKIVAEYMMMAVLTWSVWKLYSRRDFFSDSVLRRLAGAYILHILAAAAFTLYTDVYGLTNLLGHLLFFLSFLLLADALVRYMVREPQTILFRSLAASEAKFRSLADSSPDYICRFDRQCRRIYVNAAGIKVSGRTEVELLGKTPLEIGFEKQQAVFWEEKIRQVIDTASPFRTEFEWASPDGLVILDWQLAPESDEVGDITSVLSVARDITKRKRAEQIVQSSEARYHAIMEQSFEALAVVDIQTQEVVEVNRRFTELVGYSLPEDAPLYVDKFVVDSKSNLDRLYSTLLTRQRDLPVETRIYRRKNGSEVAVERAGTVISIGGRDVYLASMRDMTAERRRQAELVRDVEFAKRVQRGLLPELPDSPFVTIRTIYHPSHFVSGDAYLQEWCNEGTLLRGFLFDVSGHGLATAIQTSSINVLLREATTAKLPLLGQLQRVNASAAKYFADGAFAAILGFELDLALRELRYVGAGVTQFYANGRKIETPGMFVGLWDDAEFGAGVLPINQGDAFHFLTDGFTDALVRPEHAGFWSPDGNFNADVTALERLAESGTLRDDATAVCLNVKKLG